MASGSPIRRPPSPRARPRPISSRSASATSCASSSTEKQARSGLVVEQRPHLVLAEAGDRRETRHRPAAVLADEFLQLAPIRRVVDVEEAPDEGVGLGALPLLVLLPGRE